MGKVVMYSSVSVDGFVADENDQPGPLFDWLSSGDVPLDESGEVKVSQTSYDYTRPYWDQIGATIVGRHVFDMTDGWDGKPPGGIDHVVVVTHRPEPEGWDPEAPFHFVDGVEAAVAKAQELAGDRMVEVAAGDVGGQVLAAGLIDEVRMDVVPVVFGCGKRYFGSVHTQHLLEDPDVVIQSNRVLHLRYGCAVDRSERLPPAPMHLCSRCWPCRSGRRSSSSCPDKPGVLPVSAASCASRNVTPTATHRRPKARDRICDPDGSRPDLVGGEMPTVFGYHDVKDKDHWLASPKREEFFGPLGVTNIRTFVDPENPTRVGVLMDVRDMDAVMAAMETEAAAEAMEYDGVLAETLVMLVEA